MALTGQLVAEDKERNVSNASCSMLSAHGSTVWIEVVLV